jgi:hypothetical protein
MSVRKLGVVLAAVCAALLVVPVAAGAQTTPTTGTPTTGTPIAGIPTTSFSHIPMSSTAKNGKAFTGHFDVSQFITKGGKTYALGTLTGRIGNRIVNKKNVAIPASIQTGTATPGSTAQVASPAATCPILHLVLGPLNLNLLGLTVHLNQVVLDINAQSGAGNLLGNLLCSVANLLNGSGLPTSEVTGLLNIVQQLVNVPGLLTL